MELGLIDKIIPEPPTGAHSNHTAIAATVKQEILQAFDSLKGLSVEQLLENRIAKYRRMGEFQE